MLSKREGKILCQEGVRPRRVACGRINDDDVQILSHIWVSDRSRSCVACALLGPPS